MKKNIFKILNIVIIFISCNISFVNAKGIECEDTIINKYSNIKSISYEESIINNKLFASTTIYQQPKKEESSDAGQSLDDATEDADAFINEGEQKIKNGKLEDVSNMIYNIFVSVGVIVAVLVGAIIGIKLMFSGIEGKVEAKQLLIPYIVGCVVIFGGFGIWKMIVTIMQNT